MGALAGILYGMVAVVLSRLLIRYISVPVGAVMPQGEEIARILAQLKNARLASPWAVLALGALLGGGYGWMIRRRRKKLSRACALWLPVLVVIVPVLVFFTGINGVYPYAVCFPKDESRVYETKTFADRGDVWNFGFGRRQIIPENNGQPLYIAGYNNGLEITGVLDYCEARAVWLDTGGEGILLIGIDTIGLDSGTVAAIRERVGDIPGCAAVNVYSTHSHASVDTLGLWGHLAVNGKNDAYMQALIDAAGEAAQEAAANRKAGTLHFGKIATPDMFRDSRIPQMYDENLYQLRFSGEEGGLRLFFYGAHPEALRSENSLLSRDFPGILCDRVTEETGDDTLFLPGAIGGLIMTRDFMGENFDGVENLKITGDKLVEYALSITDEREISPELAMGSRKFTVPMDNITFLLCKALGILNHTALRQESATGYGVVTELGVLKLGGITVALIPGELFPELAYGYLYGDANPNQENPLPLYQIAGKYSTEKLLVVGLANDEIGYIVSPSDYLVNEEMPYLERIVDYKGEDHYEETVSVGPKCAWAVADTFGQVLADMEACG